MSNHTVVVRSQAKFKVRFGFGFFVRRTMTGADFNRLFGAGCGLTTPKSMADSVNYRLQDVLATVDRLPPNYVNSQPANILFASLKFLIVNVSHHPKGKKQEPKPKRENADLSSVLIFLGDVVQKVRIGVVS